MSADEGVRSDAVQLGVDPDALTHLGRRLTVVADGLSSAADQTRTAALRPLDAIATSDLWDAYAFCWGRWSRVLEEADGAIRSAGVGAVGAAHRYAAVEDQLAAVGEAGCAEQAR